MQSAAHHPIYQPHRGNEQIAGASFSIAVVAAAGLFLWGIKPHVEKMVIGEEIKVNIIPKQEEPTVIDKPIPKPIDENVPIFVPKLETHIDSSVEPPINIVNPTSQIPKIAPPPPVDAHFPTSEAKPAFPKQVGPGECQNFVSVGETASADWEKLAEREGLDKGSVSVLFTIAADGSVKDIRPENSTHTGLTRLAVKAVSHLRCNAQGQDVPKRFAVSFRIDG